MSDYEVHMFNPDEETCNFGARITDQDTLFEAVTLLTLNKITDEEAIRTETINSFIKNGFLFLSIGANWWQFAENKGSIEELTFSGKFESEIDTFLLIDKYLLICVRLGSVFLLDIEEHSLIATIDVKSNEEFEECFFVNVFEETNDESTIQCLLVTRNGDIFRLKINLLSDTDHHYDLLEAFNMRVTIASKLRNFLLLNGKEMIIYDLDENYAEFGDDLDIKKIYPYNSNQFIALTNEGSILLICARTLMVKKLENTYEDCIFYQQTNIRMLCVSKRQEEKCFIELLKYSDLDVIYSLQVPSVIHLIESTNIFDEQIFLSKCSEEQLAIKIVYETQPATRLERLLRKGKYVEAEQFAKMFKLDTECIKKAKAENLVEKTLCRTKDVEELLDLLKDIKDYAFQLQCCTNVTCEVNEMRSIFDYALNLNAKDYKMKDNNDILQQLYETMYRFDTYTMLMRCNGFDMDWNYFQNYDLYQYLLTELKQMNVEVCIALYSRFDHKIMDDITTEHLDSILAILNKWSIESSLQFFATFIPKTLQNIPQSLEQTVKWIIQKVFYMEAKQSQQFPSSALHFIEKVIKILNCDSIAQINFDNCDCDSDGILDELNLVESSLRTITELKNNFNIRMEVNVCLKGPAAILQDLLNKNLQTSCIEEFLNEFLIKFMIAHDFDPDKEFVNVIEDLVLYKEKYWIQIIPLVWRRINSIEVKLNSLIQILKYAALPWCKDIRMMLNEAIKYKHSLVDELKMKMQHENIYIVLNKEKYNLKHERIESILEKDNDFFAIERIIYCDEPSMIEDIETLCANEKKLPQAYWLILMNYMRRGRIQEAMHLVKRHNSEDVAKYVQLLLISYRDFIQCPYKQKNLTPEQHRGTFDIITLAAHKASKHLNYMDREDVTSATHTFRNLFVLKPYFKTQMKYGDFDYFTYKPFLKKLLVELSEQYKQKTLTIDGLIQMCTKLASAFDDVNVQFEDILLQLSEIVKDFNVIYHLAECCYENSQNAQILCAMATFILRTIGTDSFDLSVNTSFNSTGGENEDMDMVIDIDILYKCLEMCKKCAAKALLIDAQNGCTQYVFNWTEAFKDLLAGCRLRQQLLNSYYRDPVTAFPLASINAIRDLFTLYSDYVGHVAYSTRKLKTNDELVAVIKCRMPQIVDNLCNDGSYLTAQRLLITFNQSLIISGRLSAEISKEMQMNLFKCNATLIKQVITAKEVDESLLYSLLLYFPLKRSINILQQGLMRHERQPDNYTKIAKVGKKLLRFYNERNHDSWEKILLLSKWKRLVNFATDVDFFHLTQHELLEMLIESRAVTQEQIKEFCMDFQLDINTYYVCYLKKLLSSWQPTYEIDEDVTGNRNLLMKSNEDDLIKNCTSILDVIDNKETVYKFIEGLWNSVNVYHYEVFLCMFHLLPLNMEQDKCRRRRRLLQFLKTYTRTNKPTSNEKEEWFTNFPDSHHIEPLSEWRLPFSQTLFTKALFNILRPELNLDTYTKWFDVIDTLNNPHFTKNVICTYAIKNVVGSGILASPNPNNEWQLHPKHQSLFEEIDNCIKCMSDMEQVTSALYHLTVNTPRGADQVKAAELCFNYAQIYRDDCMKSEGDLVHKAYIKVYKKYHSFASMHILHVNNLAEENYLQMVHKPKELIETLYMDARIIKLNGISKCPNINKAVDELALLFNIDIFKERIGLLEKWLNSGNVSSINMDESIYIEPTFNISIKDGDNTLKRAIYICHSGNIEEWQSYLIQKSFYENNKYNFQARLIQCYAAISTPEEILENTELDKKQLMLFIDRLFLLHNLQSFGLNMQMEELTQLDVNSFLKKLSKKASNPLCLKIMISMCILHNINDVEYWELMLNTMIKLKMLDEIKTSVNFLKSDVMLYKPFYIVVWQNIVDNLFNFHAPDDLNQKFIDNMLFLQSCPVINCLKLSSICSKCIQMKKYAFAAWLTQFCKKENVYSILKHILQDINKANLTSSLQELSGLGFVGTSYVIDYLSEI